MVLVLVFSGFEALARRRFVSFLGSLLLVLVVVTVAVGLVALFLRHWRTALSLVIGFAALALLVANLRTLRQR